MTNFPLGAHVHAETAIDDAKARGASIIQIMIGAPTAWKGHELAFPGGASALKGAAQEAGVGIYVHAPYIINVASLNNRSEEHTSELQSRGHLVCRLRLATNKKGGAVNSR